MLARLVSLSAVFDVEVVPKPSHLGVQRLFGCMKTFFLLVKFLLVLSILLLSDLF